MIQINGLKVLANVLMKAIKIYKNFGRTLDKNG